MHAGMAAPERRDPQRDDQLFRSCLKQAAREPNIAPESRSADGSPTHAAVLALARDYSALAS
jgi:hypothetical protein